MDRLEAKFKFYINDVLRSRYRHDSRHDTAVKMMALANASLPSDTAPVPALVRIAVYLIKADSDARQEDAEVFCTAIPIFQ